MFSELMNVSWHSLNSKFKNLSWILTKITEAIAVLKYWAFRIFFLQWDYTNRILLCCSLLWGKCKVNSFLFHCNVHSLLTGHGKVCVVYIDKKHASQRLVCFTSFTAKNLTKCYHREEFVLVQLLLAEDRVYEDHVRHGSNSFQIC